MGIALSWRGFCGNRPDRLHEQQNNIAVNRHRSIKRGFALACKKPEPSLTEFSPVLELYNSNSESFSFHRRSNMDEHLKGLSMREAEVTIAGRKSN